MTYRRGTMHPKFIGDRTTAMVLAALLKHFDSVLLPFGENCRYDLLIEDGNEFIGCSARRGGCATAPSASVLAAAPITTRAPRIDGD